MKHDSCQCKTMGWEMTESGRLLFIFFLSSFSYPLARRQERERGWRSVAYYAYLSHQLKRIQLFTHLQDALECITWYQSQLLAAPSTEANTCNCVNMITCAHTSANRMKQRYGVDLCRYIRITIELHVKLCIDLFSTWWGVPHIEWNAQLQYDAAFYET